ncbi:MAG: DUF1028 domain-containing protein [Candidatus Eisenbacteria bacterium]
MLTLTCLVPALAVCLTGAAGPAPCRPVHTYSIVARDSLTGQIGVAVQSHWFSVGSVVSWAEAGVGAVATQSFAEPGYGPRGLDQMRGGASAAEALDSLLAGDPERELRQVAFIDRNGNTAVYTGSKCIEWAGHRTGKGYSVQANLMRNDRVVDAMAAAYEKAEGELAGRLLAALEAGESAGGDIRGSQSAALLVVEAEASDRPWADRLVDLRVEDHPDPVGELRRLLTVHGAYEHMNRGDRAVEKGDLQEARVEYEAAARLFPGNPEMTFWYAVSLATSGALEESFPLFREVFRADPGWREVMKRLTKPGIIPDTPEGAAMVERILSVR